MPFASTFDNLEVRGVGALLVKLNQLWQWRYPALAFALLFVVRTYWQIDPGLATAAAYWIGLLGVLLWFLRRFNFVRTPVGVLLLGGFALNATVTLANGGFMPIPGEAQHGIYEPLTGETKLSWLADVLPLKSSIGDWLVGAGLLGFARTVVIRPHRAVSPSSSI